jgi:hypothetical protein
MRLMSNVEETNYVEHLMNNVLTLDMIERPQHPA